jgi:hypothetical protein
LHFVWEVQVGRGPTPFTNDNVRGSGCDLLVIKDANVNELIAMFASYLPALAGFVHKAVAFECLFSSHFFQVVSFFVRFGFPFGGCGLSFLGNGGGGGGGGGGGAAVVVTAGGVIVWKIEFAGWVFVFDDSTVVGDCCFFGGSVCTKVIVFVVKIDRCRELFVVRHFNSTIPRGVCRGTEAG